MTEERRGGSEAMEATMAGVEATEGAEAGEATTEGTEAGEAMKGLEKRAAPCLLKSSKSLSPLALWYQECLAFLSHSSRIHGAENRFGIVVLRG